MNHNYVCYLVSTCFGISDILRENTVAVLKKQLIL
jgi:hypothetical protein